MLVGGVILILIGIVIFGLQKTKGMFMRTAIHRTLPKFLIANGIFLPVPWHIIYDGLLFYVLWVVVVEIYHHTSVGKPNVD